MKIKNKNKYEKIREQWVFDFLIVFSKPPIKEKYELNKNKLLINYLKIRQQGDFKNCQKFQTTYK